MMVPLGGDHIGEDQPAFRQGALQWFAYPARDGKGKGKTFATGGGVGMKIFALREASCQKIPTKHKKQKKL